MENIVTLLTFTYPSELYAIKGKLESEGIECFVKDELTVQMNPLYSNAIGGVKLQVKERDVPKALAIIKEAGYFTEESTNQANHQLYRLVSKLPFLNKIPPLFSLLTITAIIVALFSFLIIWMISPTLEERLNSNFWRVDKIVNNKTILKPRTTGFRIITSGMCEEYMRFDPKGEVYLPGINSFSIEGRWKLEDEQLTLKNMDTLNTIYEGTYEVIMDRDRIILSSSSTKIYGRLEKF